MSTRSILQQAKLNDWASRFADQKASGLSIKEWCSQNNMSQHKYFYWKRILKENAIEQALPEIVPLAMPSVPIDPSPVIPSSTDSTRESCASCTSFASNSCARLYVNGICIELDSSASEAFIRNLIKAVRHA